MGNGKPAYDDAVLVPTKPPNLTWKEHFVRFVTRLPIERDFMGGRIYRPLRVTQQALDGLLEEMKPYTHQGPVPEGVVNLFMGHPIIVEE